MRFLVALAGIGMSAAASAGVNGAVFFGVPTLDEVGLAALVGIVGALGGWLAGRRKK